MSLLTQYFPTRPSSSTVTANVSQLEDAAALMASQADYSIPTHTYGDSEETETEDENEAGEDVDLSPAQKLFKANFGLLPKTKVFKPLLDALSLKPVVNWNALMSRFGFSNRFEAHPSNSTPVSMLFTVPRDAESTLRNCSYVAGCFARAVKATISALLPQTSFRFLDMLEVGTEDGHDASTGHCVLGSAASFPEKHVSKFTNARLNALAALDAKHDVSYGLAFGAWPWSAVKDSPSNLDVGNWSFVGKTRWFCLPYPSFFFCRGGLLMVRYQLLSACTQRRRPQRPDAVLVG